LWDAASTYGDVVLETSGSGSTLASYVLGGIELLSQTRGGTTSYYLHDGQGNTSALADVNGNVTDTYRYSAFGELQSRTGTTINNYLYTGQQFDSLTRLYSLRARYYAPYDGRFISRDVFSYNFNNPIELDRYVYTADNPVNAVDFTGLFAETAALYRNSEEETPAVESTGIATETLTAVAQAKTRALLLQNLFRGIEFRKRTVAVGWIITKLGERIRVVAVSGSNWSKTVAGALDEGELMLVDLSGHAEVIIMEYANQVNAVGVAIGAGRQPCPECLALARALASKFMYVILR